MMICQRFPPTFRPERATKTARTDDEYRHALREAFGSGNFRVERDGTIRAKLAGSWIVYGWRGRAETDVRLFGERRG